EMHVDIDSSLSLILDIFLKEITHPLPKAEKKFMKEQRAVYNYNLTYDCFSLLGKYVSSQESIETIVERLDELLKKVHDVDVIKRFQQIFQRLASGLNTNKVITEEFLMHYIYDTI